MKIQNLKLHDLRPYWRNPRKNEAAVNAVKQSIVDYGMNQPIVIDSEGVIICGHTRYKALLELGAATAPCVTVDMSPQKAKEYRIADNKASELAEWDMSALIPELRELGDTSSMQIYFGEADLDALLAETGGINNVAITQQQVEDATQKAADQFREIETNATSGQVEIRCAHCGEQMFISSFRSG